VWWLQWKHHGVPYALSLKTRDAAVARAAGTAEMAAIRASIADGSFLRKHGREGSSAVEGGDIRLSDAWLHYRNSASRPDASTQTVQQYEYQWGRLLEWLRLRHPEARRVSQVTRQVAQEFATHLLKEVSPSTYNRYVQLFRLIFRLLLEDLGLPADANPWRAIQKKNGNGHGGRRGRRAFTDEELRRVFETLSARVEGRQLLWGEEGVVGERKLGKRDRRVAAELLTLCLLGFHTGLRMGDCCVLRWEDVDLDRGVISVVPMKTARTSGRKVVIPIHPELGKHLTSIRPKQAAGPVCLGKAEQYPRGRPEVSKRFRVLFRQCGIRTQAEGSGARAACEVGFHSFRHTWVSRAAEDGVDQITVREIVGWGSPAMEKVYTHVSQEHVRSQMEKRASKAFADGADEAEAKPPATPDVSGMTVEQMRELAVKLAAEIAKREAR
jgi:integrase